ncbi:BA14K family protein [Rhizobium oryzicola]|uniref:Lectin-like protein BA14k n=1 Tax=Rhizobium oryzicola TaxID=1232668 RepID=A0ABT8STL9_9HYPH|nr:BA14K family protein [Rhizobium oryzicola]MDO1581243.1 BA14K family protein [Rhizobium oryzicola]
MKKFSLLGLSAAMLTASILPSQAMPMISAPAPAVPSGDVVQVQYWRHYGGPGYWRGGGYYRPSPYARPGWYGGYRGYRYERPGYRYHNGFWFPLAAFGAGAIIGGAIASEPRYVAPAPRAAGVNPQHYQYCAARYRSYDAYSNTFQPYNGPRQQCYSPYY